ncbi:MAG: PAS domain S-box protein [Luteibaculaceae bacterium]
MGNAEITYIKNLAKLRLYSWFVAVIFIVTLALILGKYYDSRNERFVIQYQGYLEALNQRVTPQIDKALLNDPLTLQNLLAKQAQKSSIPLQINVYKINNELVNKPSGNWILVANSGNRSTNAISYFNATTKPSIKALNNPTSGYLASRVFLANGEDNTKFFVEYKLLIEHVYIQFLKNEKTQFYLLSLLLAALTAGIILSLNAIFSFVKRREAELLKKELELSNSFKSIYQVLDSIAEGNYDAPIETENRDNNELVEALLSMRSRLHETKLTEEGRNWYNKGVADVSSILRKEDDIQELGYRLLEYLVPATKSAIGGFYRFNPNSNELELYASFGYNRRKYTHAKVKIGFGITGTAAFERKSVYRTEVPADFFTIRSGLIDDKKPVAVFVVPLLAENILYGALELASTQNYSTQEIEFLEGLGEIVARTMHSLAVNAETRRLLEESQAMGEELQERKTELEKYTEDLRDAQINLEASNEQLEKQIREVELSQQRLHSLLLNASEIILLYGSDKVLKFVSPSVNQILGLGAEMLMGTSDFDKIEPSFREDFEAMFTSLVKNEITEKSLEYQYQKADGSYIWMQCIAINKLDDPAINGILLNVRDITERKRAEAEQEMRGRMQSLSENSLDVIIRLMLDTEISYINPSITHFTSLLPKDLLGFKIDSTQLPQPIIAMLHELMGQVSSTSEKQTVELEFEGKDGERVVTANAIPEFDKNGKLDSVLFVLHDITHRKAIELELQDKNQKITDSINYARHIQNAIIPSMKQISSTFPNSFMFYKPKDVVSGDFPWYLEKGDDVYIAAVDCTGHGVPGAMMSLIGYFLLNEINSHTEVESPAGILDKLHAAVRYHLKQDQEGAEARDGMDVALIKYNRKENILQYSGAHRPLYMVRNGELEQFKGNKKAIGGTSSRGDDNFTDYTITIQPNDTYLVFSDGLPDQFGGPDGKKFSPKKIREIALRNENNSVKTLESDFENEFNSWLNGHKQIDDVLLIGIKF